MSENTGHGFPSLCQLDFPVGDKRQIRLEEACEAFQREVREAQEFYLELNDVLAVTVVDVPSKKGTFELYTAYIASSSRHLFTVVRGSHDEELGFTVTIESMHRDEVAFFAKLLCSKPVDQTGAAAADTVSADSHE